MVFAIFAQFQNTAVALNTIRANSPLVNDYHIYSTTRNEKLLDEASLVQRCNGHVESDCLSRYYYTNAGSHVYPYLATAVTFSCLLIILFIIIQFGGNA
jgi:hypothetical protein